MAEQSYEPKFEPFAPPMDITAPKEPHEVFWHVLHGSREESARLLQQHPELSAPYQKYQDAVQTLSKDGNLDLEDLSNLRRHEAFLTEQIKKEYSGAKSESANPSASQTSGNAEAITPEQALGAIARRVLEGNHTPEQKDLILSLIAENANNAGYSYVDAQSHEQRRFTDRHEEPSPAGPVA